MEDKVKKLTRTAEDRRSSMEEELTKKKSSVDAEKEKKTKHEKKEFLDDKKTFQKRSKKLERKQAEQDAQATKHKKENLRLRDGQKALKKENAILQKGQSKLTQGVIELNTEKRTLLQDKFYLKRREAEFKEVTKGQGETEVQKDLM